MNRFKNILYVNQATADQASAVERAVSLAENNQAKLTIIDVIPAVSDDYRKGLIDDRTEALKALTQHYKPRLEIAFDVLQGTSFVEIIRQVLRNSHDLLIKTAENPSFLKRLFSSDDMHLLRKCPCPVWLMKTPEKSNYNCILAAVDFDPLKPTETEQALNQNILELAGSLAISDFASLHIVHAWEAFSERILLSRSGKTTNVISDSIDHEKAIHQKGLNAISMMLQEQVGPEAYNYLSPRFHLLKGEAKKRIVESALELDADVVVMGTVARTGISGLIIGNTAETILDQVQCSVLAIKPPGFATPVKLPE